MNANFTMPELMDVQGATDNPRLARGLVREELRPYKALLDKPVYRDMHNLLKALVERYMPPSGKFSTPTAAKLHKRLIVEAAKHFRPIRPFDVNTFMVEGDAKPAPVHGFFYWLPTKAEVNHLEPDKAFVGDFVELRCMRVSATRRRLMFDDAFCHFIVSEHCLARILERGAAPREPLADMTQQLDAILPAAVMLAAAHGTGKHRDVPHALIPYKDGILLCKVSLFDVNDEARKRWHRFRSVSNKIWTKSEDFLLEPLLMLDGKVKGAVSIYAATYIPKMQMSSEQIWAKMQMEQLIEEESEYLQGYSKMVYLTEDLDAKVAERLPFLLQKLAKIIRNSRWKIATSAALMQSS